MNASACSCGFDDGSVSLDAVEARTLAAIAAIAEVMASNEASAAARPSAERWSIVEYAAHVRDVLLTVRDRLVIGLVEDDPGFKPLYRDERVELGLYRADPAAAVGQELASAAAMFVRLFSAIEPNSLSRTVQYGHPGPVTRTLGWMGTQAVHEAEHHLTDMEENLRLLSA